VSGDTRRRPSGAMVVAVIALVVALAGTAFAGPVAAIASKLIDGSTIKPHTIPGNRLVDHTLTGRQLNKSKLGTIPRAHLADLAGNAARLGGAAPGSYLASSNLLRWNYAMNKGSAAHKIGQFGPLTLTATCAADGANTNATLAVTTNEANTFVSTSPEALPGTGTTLNPGNPPYPIVEQDTATADDGNSNALAAFDPKGKLAVFSTAQTIGVAINTPGADCRFFGYLVNDS
jgi:hypothetical protein